MSAEWPLVRLGDHIDSCLGKMLDKKKNKGDFYPYLGNSNVRWGLFDLLDLAEMRFEDGEHERYGVRSGDLIVCEGGEPGRCAIWQDEVPNMKIQKALHRIRPKRSLNNYYLYYWFLQASKEGLLEPYFTGTTIKHLTGKALSELQVELPPVQYQKAIVGVLRPLDEKIRLNHKIEQTLEQMAQAIFKSWFVDFEPVKAKIAALEAGGSEEDALLAAMRTISGKSDEQLERLEEESPERYAELEATAELFPTAMQETELGEVPKGWEATTFGEVSTCLDKHRIPLSKRQREKKRGTIPYYGATSVMDYVDEHIFDDVYFLLGEDGSVLRGDGTPFVQYIWGKAWVNNHAHVLQGANGISTEQLMCFSSMQNIAAYVTGAVQLKLNQKNMNTIPFIKASDEVNERFCQMVDPLYAQYRALVDQSDTLSALRNTLLPNLLSGELKISEAEEPMAEVQDVAHV